MAWESTFGWLSRNFLDFDIALVHQASLIGEADPSRALVLSHPDYQDGDAESWARSTPATLISHAKLHKNTLLSWLVNIPWCTRNLTHLKAGPQAGQHTLIKLC